MFKQSYNLTKDKNDIKTLDLLTAYKMFRESRKDEFLELFGNNIERVYKEALCLKQLTFNVTDGSASIFSEITKRIASILVTEKCAVYTFCPLNNEYILESHIFGQSHASLKLSKIKASADTLQINEIIENLFETKQTLITYLKVNDKVTGILAVANKLDKSDFNDEDEYFINLCAGQTAILIENHRLYKQISAQAARESVINRINNSIRSSLDLNTVLSTAVNEIGSTLKVNICNILKFNYEKDIAIVTHEYNTQGEYASLSIGTVIPISGSAINSQIVATLKPVVINDALTSQYISHNPATKYRIIDTIQAKSILAIPIVYENKVLGTLSLNQCDRVRKWSQEDIQILESVAAQLGVAINQASLMTKIKALAAKDELTGLINRRNFYERLLSEIERIKRHPGYLSFALFDIDYFKKFNDNYGHLAGDYVLREIGRITAENIRKSDVAARYGGEEFSLILPETNLQDGYELLERLRKRIEEHNFEFQSQKLNVTISGGIIQLGPLSDNKNLDVDYLISESIDKADNLLYKAKKSGRNMICQP